jgi:uncharacterized protein YprB with RNaseH-like and TPR domain
MPLSLDKFSRLAALKPVRQVERFAESAGEPGQEDELAQLIGAVTQKTRFGQHLAMRNWYSTPEFVAPASQALDLLTRNKDEALSRRTRTALENPEKWLFLDTETTGLAGGTGTYAFLVGIAWWDAGGLQVEQFFMRDFADEHSVLSELAERIAERPALVTFNGKTFDWPLLESRFTMTRKISVPRLAAHLDLLHPARALWKLRLGSVRLVELERQVLDAERLGWNRTDDVPSSFIPQFYFDYLRGASARPLAGVVRHNQMDLRGLAALFGKINSMLAEEELAETDGRDLFGLSRYLHRRGDAPRAARMCTKALEVGLPAEHRQQASRELAIMAKRRGDHPVAAELWRSLLLQGSQNTIEACEQLAIHYERRERDLQQALEYTQLGLNKLRSGGIRLRDPYVEARIARQENGLLRRLGRLQQRLSNETAPPPKQAKRSTAAAAGRLL